ncbi:MAG: RHS repeat-associated core domain-containing protein, partial [Aureliella sp.]
AAVDMLFAFTGKQLDDSTGLQHNLFRWYDGNSGQWLSEDPLGFEAGDANVGQFRERRRAILGWHRIAVSGPKVAKTLALSV